MIAIFLDIDGVLNRRANAALFNPECVGVLNRILAGVAALEPVVVLSSWHRHNMTATQATEALRRVGYCGPAIRHETPMFADGAQLRDKEILKWLEWACWEPTNGPRTPLPITHVLVLDDDYEAGEGPLRAHHVMPTDGLTDAHVGEALTRAEAPWTPKRGHSEKEASR